MDGRKKLSGGNLKQTKDNDNKYKTGKQGKASKAGTREGKLTGIHKLSVDGIPLVGIHEG